jgi:hypothetical protein
VADLTPNTTYSITGTGTPSTCTTDPAGVCAFAATGTGNIVLSSGGVTLPAVNLGGTVKISGNVVLP